MIQIYCGEGKGKTTAAAGLAVRAAGNHIPVIFAQFMKDGNSGEIAVLKEIPGIRVLYPDLFYGFVRNMDEQQKEEMRIQYITLLNRIEKEMEGMQADMAVIVLDEVLHACNFGLLEEDRLCCFLDHCPDTAELILTGWNPSRELIRRADYISEIKKVKHPFDKGIPARRGIEF